MFSQVFPKVADADNSAACQCNLPLKTVSTGSVSDFWKNTTNGRVSNGIAGTHAVLSNQLTLVKISTFSIPVSSFSGSHLFLGDS